MPQYMIAVDKYPRRRPVYSVCSITESHFRDLAGRAYECRGPRLSCGCRVLVDAATGEDRCINEIYLQPMQCDPDNI